MHLDVFIGFKCVLFSAYDFFYFFLCSQFFSFTASLDLILYFSFYALHIIGPSVRCAGGVRCQLLMFFLLLSFFCFLLLQS